MKESFKDMIESTPMEAWAEWEMEKQGETFGDANVVIAIAKWRAKDIIKKQLHEDMLMDEWMNG
jgi:hypothetical protein